MSDPGFHLRTQSDRGYLNVVYSPTPHLIKSQSVNQMREDGAENVGILPVDLTESLGIFPECIQVECLPASHRRPDHRSSGSAKELLGSHPR
jgi:hypothetical protein